MVGSVKKAPVPVDRFTLRGVEYEIFEIEWIKRNIYWLYAGYGELAAEVGVYDAQLEAREAAEAGIDELLSLFAKAKRGEIEVKELV